MIFPMRLAPIFPLLLAALCGALPALPCHAADDGEAPGTAAIVAGIIHFTRWPGARPAVRLCLSGKSAEFDSIRQIAPAMEKAGRPIHFVELADMQEAPALCDLVYVGGQPGEEAGKLISLVAGKPVLTIGETPTFCSLGGMFCLNLGKAEGSAPFSANLNAISGSGLRISPQVLRLSSQLGKKAQKP
jgi:hypothetical protein